MKNILIIDTDPSIDDAIAFLMAIARHDLFDKVIINTTAGNSTITNVTNNALKILELVEARHIIVNRGASAPLVKAHILADHVYGKMGLDGLDLPNPSMTASLQSSYDCLIDTVVQNPPGTVTLCCLAPLTNVAIAIKKRPDIIHKIKKIIIMGGAFSEAGNITPAAEFNIYVDPEAAQIVFTSFPEVVCIPLDCTHKAIITKDILERFRRVSQPLGNTLYILLKYAKAYDTKKYNFGGAPLHDPTVIAYLIDKNIFSTKKVSVKVDARNGLTRGATIVDQYNNKKYKNNVLLVDGIDDSRYFDVVFECLDRYPLNQHHHNDECSPTYHEGSPELP